MEANQTETRPGWGMIILLVIDVVLFVGLCLQLGFVVPVFGEMYADFGVTPPAPARQLLGAARGLMQFHGAGLYLTTCAGVGLLTWGYRAASRSGGRSRAARYLWSVLFLAFVLGAAMTISVFLPLFHMVEPAGATP